jgi:hypothetical protein
MIDWKWYPQFIGLVRDPQGKHYKKMGMAKWLFDYFCAQAGRETGEWTGSLDRIGKETGIPPWSVKRYLAVLKKGGYVEAAKTKGGVRIRIKKFKTLVKKTAEPPTVGDISADERTPLEKNPKSRLYVACVEELLEYFKKALSASHLSNIDTYTVLQMYWAKIPLCVIKSSVEEVAAKSKDRSIFTVKYFKRAIYENHRRLTPKMEPEEELMSEDQKKEVDRFKKAAQSTVKEVRREEAI